jgi:hypothetical protein
MSFQDSASNINVSVETGLLTALLTENGGGTHQANMDLNRVIGVDGGT